MNSFVLASKLRFYLSALIASMCHLCSITSDALYNNFDTISMIIESTIQIIITIFTLNII